MTMSMSTLASINELEEVYFVAEESSLWVQVEERRNSAKEM